MVWIWFSVLLISLGGLVSLYQKNENKIFLKIVLITIFLIIFLVLQGLKNLIFTFPMQILKKMFLY